MQLDCMPSRVGQLCARNRCTYDSADPGWRNFSIVRLDPMGDAQQQPFPELVTQDLFPCFTQHPVLPLGHPDVRKQVKCFRFWGVVILDLFPCFAQHPVLHLGHPDVRKQVRRNFRQEKVANCCGKTTVIHTVLFNACGLLATVKSMALNAVGHCW